VEARLSEERPVVSRERKLRQVVTAALHSLRLEPVEDGYRTDTGTTIVRSTDSPLWSVITRDGRSFEVSVELVESEVEAAIGSARFRFALGAAPVSTARRGASSGRIEVKSPMPGRVVKLLVTPGQSVTAGQPVLLFEAMKMQNELRSPETGVVSEIAVEAGQAVEARERLYVVSPSP
jgi:biotin carboxyl carrier protein